MVSGEIIIYELKAPEKGIQNKSDKQKHVKFFAQKT
jgi:hypothetical protein